MKNIITSLIIVLGTVFSLQAQNYNNAVGLRLGWGFGGTIKHFFGESAAVEGIVRFGGSTFSSYTQVTGLYQVHKPLDEVITGLQWYYGGGGFIGFFGGRFSDNEVRIGIAGCIGLDYAFEDVPLNISIDWVPGFAIVGFGNGFTAEAGGLAVRYIF